MQINFSSILKLTEKTLENKNMFKFDSVEINENPNLIYFSKYVVNVPVFHAPWHTPQVNVSSAEVSQAEH